MWMSSKVQNSIFGGGGVGGSCNLKADSYLYSRAKDINKSVKWESNMLHFVSFVVLLAEDYIFKK